MSDTNKTSVLIKDCARNDVVQVADVLNDKGHWIWVWAGNDQGKEKVVENYGGSVGNSWSSWPDWQPDITARISLYPTETGGRAYPLYSGLDNRCAFSWSWDGRSENMFDCWLLPEPGLCIPPGGEATVGILIIARANLSESDFNVGKKFYIWDGRPVAEGKILEIHPPRKNNALRNRGVP